MERYCAIKCKRADFQQESKNTDIISYGKTVEKYVGNKKEEILRDNLRFTTFGNYYMNERDIKGILYTIFDCNECELDILMDIYIILKNGSGDTDKLYDDGWNDKGEKRSASGCYNQLKDFINIIKKGNSKGIEIFDISYIKNGMRANINVCGLEVQRLWFVSGGFRNLFKITDRGIKYEQKNVLDTIQDKYVKNFKLDDKIILEKLLGLNTVDYFFKYLDYTEKENIKLLNRLMEWDGEYSRCAVIRALNELIKINSMLKSKAYGNNEMTKKVIEVWDKESETLKQKYREILQERFELIKNTYSINDAMKAVENRINELIEINNQFRYWLNGIDNETGIEKEKSKGKLDLQEQFELEAEVQKQIIEKNMQKYKIKESQPSV